MPPLAKEATAAPTTLPMATTTIASRTNCSPMVRLGAPIAFSTPISRRRSRTSITMIRRMIRPAVPSAAMKAMKDGTIATVENRRMFVQGRDELLSRGLRFFPGLYKQFIFVSIAVVDSGNFKGREEIEALHVDLWNAKVVRGAMGGSFRHSVMHMSGEELVGDDAHEAG